ncbi:type III-A CRISPR-associated protein Csm2 [Deinococcus sp. A31D244]|jgi:CRISPR type III-A-associated protein Csm2|uniref:type III-A CRISPR-associated protein Csm2 n=1 Tax=unclassified Deinococcus TaxID=2623546 RepID=UPI0006DC4B3E|nr:type III-A CRISPR-associated protein Csm2 [Deinococcus sp. UR1]PIG97182.1 type III-A CRISPR-associated protein Csm2 [Deinococcus sp. UR1]
MSWTQEFKTARGDAATLSDIGDFNQLVSLAETVGRELQGGGVSSRQIRVLLSETTAGVSRIRRGRTLGIDAASPDRAQQDRAAQREAALLNISLVYSAGRAKSGETYIRQLTDLMGEVTGNVRTFEDFKVLRKFSEAVMAYFKFHGGK